MPILPEAIHKLSTIPINIATKFFTEIKSKTSSTLYENTKIQNG